MGRRCGTGRGTGYSLADGAWALAALSDCIKGRGSFARRAAQSFHEGHDHFYVHIRHLPSFVVVEDARHRHGWGPGAGRRGWGLRYGVTKRDVMLQRNGRVRGSERDVTLRPP